MNFSETSSRGFQKDPITSIRAHISQKKREFDTLSNTNDGLLLQEAFARAASGSRQAGTCGSRCTFVIELGTACYRAGLSDPAPCRL